MSAAPDLVGRDEDLEALAAFLDDPRSIPQALVIEGDPGIGKTSLWRAGVQAAGRRSFTILSTAPVQAETKLAFAGLGDLLAPVSHEVLDHLPRPQCHALEVALLLEEGTGRRPEQRTLGVAVLNALSLLAERGSTLLAIDDVQWLDASTARVLAFAVRRLSTGRCRVLLARRSERGRALPLGLAAAWGPDRLQVRWVGPLSLGALHRMLADRLGVVFPRPTLRRLHAVSGGNPLFALELARALARRDRSLEPGEPLPVPDQLRDLVRDRLAALPPETRSALAVAAALSEPTTGLIAAAEPEGDAEEQLMPAVEADIVRFEGDEVQFTHPLLATAAYGGLSPTKRRNLHRTLAGLVPDLEERARHLGLSAEGPDEDVARVLEAASSRAAARGAQDAAADLSAHARRLTPPGQADRIRDRALLEAEYALQSGDTPRADAVLRETLGSTPHGAGRAAVLTALARVHFSGFHWSSALALLEQASRASSGDPALRAEIELHTAITLDLLRTDVRRTLRHARAAVRLAESAGDATTLSEAVIMQAKTEFLLGRPWPADLVERALGLSDAAASLPVVRRAIDYMASMLGWSDDLPGAIQALEEIQATAGELGDEVSMNWALVRSAEVRCHAGDWHGALRDTERGTEIAAQTGQTAHATIFLALRALADASLGAVASAREAGARALAEAAEAGAPMARRVALAALGSLELSLDRPAEAHRHLGPLTEETLAAGVGHPGATRFLPDEIESLVGLGQLEEADALHRFLRSRAKATGTTSALAAAERCRGLLAAARGDLDGARDALAGALSQLDGASMPVERGRVLLAIGKVHRRAKRQRAAREALEGAVATFEGLAAGIWAERARGELRRVGGRRPSSDGLTPGERRLAELVAEGRSNREAAAALFVTVKTVDTKLSRIYEKLGIHSRMELARRIAEERATKT